MAVGPLLAHSVYFRLKDNSTEARKKFIASCKKYLTDHPGTAFFAVGGRALDIEWAVSDRGFDVVLLLVFESKAAHDEYQDSPRHQQFLEENEPNWAEIRVFDAYVEQEY